MKRIAVILMCCLAVLCAQADTYETHSNFKKIEKQHKERIPLKFEFYGKVGLNIMSADWGSNGFRYDAPKATGKSTVGFDLNLGFISHFRPSNPSNFYWGAELGLTQAGGGYDGFSYESYNGECIYPSSSKSQLGVVISPSIGWKKKIADNINIDLHFNPGYFHLFKGFENEYIYSDNSNYITDWEKHFVSFKIGAGIWYKRWNFDLSYRKITDFGGTTHTKYSNIIISVGYRF